VCAGVGSQSAVHMTVQNFTSQKEEPARSEVGEERVLELSIS